MCNNTIELAGNPYTIEPATGLSSDPTYNPTDKLPNWLKRRIERQKRLQEIYNRIPWYAKVIVGTVLLAASIALTLVSRTGGAGIASIFIQLALGIGIGVGTYLASSLLTNTFTLDGLLNTVLDTFVITAAVIFISVGINYVKYISRSSSQSQIIDGVELQRAQQLDFTQESWNRINSLSKRADGSTISTMSDGRFIHKGFKTNYAGFGKEYTLKGVGRVDYYDIANKIIYELKPNNASSIAKGIKQLHRYNAGLGGGYKLVLVLY